MHSIGVYVVVVEPRSKALTERHKMLGTVLPMYQQASEVPPMNHSVIEPMQVVEAEEEVPMSELIQEGNSRMSSSEHLAVDHLKILASWVTVLGS